MRFKAYAKVYKFKEAIGPDPENDLPAKEADALDETNNKDKPLIAAKRRNETAMACFSMDLQAMNYLGIYMRQ